MMSTAKLKIIFLTADDAELGTYFRWHNFGKGLVDLGHSVTVFCVDNNDVPRSRVENRNGVIYNITKSAKGKSLFGTINHPITSFKRIFGDFPECDILHVFQPFLSVYLPWRFSFKRKAKITFFDWDDLWVDEIRDKEKRSFKNNWNYKFQGYFEHKIPAVSTRMTVCSKLLQTLATERGAKQADILPNGFWEYDVPEKQLSRAKLGLDKDAHYVGFMGRTGFELRWAFNAFAESLKLGINIRFALCGPNPDILDGLSDDVKSRIDYLGSLPPLDTRYFAAAIDLGLLPLMKTPFNESRFPIKFAEYLAADLPVLCSEVGEINEYGKKYPWVIKAGINEDEWMAGFANAIQLLVAGKLVPVDRAVVLNDLSWQGIAKHVEQLYLREFKKL